MMTRREITVYVVSYEASKPVGSFTTTLGATWKWTGESITSPEEIAQVAVDALTGVFCNEGFILPGILETEDIVYVSRVEKSTELEGWRRQLQAVLDDFTVEERNLIHVKMFRME